MIKIFLNPGHDGSPSANGGAVDCGAINEEYGAQECDIALAIGERVKAYLEAAGGYEVKLLQQDNLAGEDAYIYKGSVCEQANSWGADYFISIHCDSFSKPSANGTSCWVMQYGTRAARLADCIQDNITKRLGTYNRGTRTASFSVLKNTMMPAVLVETAFISNENDVQKLMYRQDDFAKAIAVGITDAVSTMGW